jgi:hypothetical protein
MSQVTQNASLKQVMRRGRVKRGRCALEMKVLELKGSRKQKGSGADPTKLVTY